MNRAVSFAYINRQLVWNEFRNCCCCFFLFSIHQPLEIFFVHSQRIYLQVLQGMKLCAPSAKRVQPFHFLLYHVSTGTATTGFEHIILQLLHSSAPDAMSQLFPYSSMVVQSTMSFKNTDYFKRFEKEKEKKKASTITNDVFQALLLN